jgi:CrcB protein
MQKVILVGVGGFIGAIFRYALSGLVYRLAENPYFPYGTLAVNVLGCLIIGFLGGLAENSQIFNPEIRVLVFIGILGSFTTFSTFGYEIFTFLRDGQILASAANLISHIILGLGAVWLGYILAHSMRGV